MGPDLEKVAGIGIEVPARPQRKGKCSMFPPLFLHFHVSFTINHCMHGSIHCFLATLVSLFHYGDIVSRVLPFAYIKVMASVPSVRTHQNLYRILGKSSNVICLKAGGNR